MRQVDSARSCRVCSRYGRGKECLVGNGRTVVENRKGFPFDRVAGGVGDRSAVADIAGYPAVGCVRSVVGRDISIRDHPLQYSWWNVLRTHCCGDLRCACTSTRDGFNRADVVVAAPPTLAASRPLPRARKGERPCARATSAPRLPRSEPAPVDTRWHASRARSYDGNDRARYCFIACAWSWL